MSSTREAIKCSLLQLKTTKRTGTLRKKTKLVYSDPQWVVLCLHDNRIPFLEWYHTEESIRDHRPTKIIDLLYTSYVNPVLGDPRAFVIGLPDVEPIQLVALQPQTTSEWVEVTTETLQRLSILSGSTNIYEPGTSKQKSTPEKLSPEPTKENYQVRLKMGPAQVMQNREERVVSPCAHVSFRGTEQRPCSMRPPLPPRRPHDLLRPRRSGSFSELSMNNPSIYSTLGSPYDDQAPTPHLLSPLYDTPRSEIAGVATPPRSPRHRTICDPTPSIYDSLSPTHRCGTSSIQSTVSTNSLCSSVSSELRLSTVLPISENGDYDFVRNGYHNRVKYVSLNLSIIVEHVLFVEMKGRIWVAGWTDVQDKQLSTMLSFADELVEVEGQPISGMSDIPQIFYNSSSPGTPISLVFRPTPFGVNITLMKPIRKTKDIGIILHKRKNRIADVIPDSSAARRGVTAVLPSAFHGEHQSSSVITEIAGKRLNPFAKNDQFYSKYDEVREGSEFSITIHPHDFMKEMKVQISSTKNYKLFLPVA